MMYLCIGGVLNGRRARPDAKGTCVTIVQHEDRPQDTFVYDLRRLDGLDDALLVHRALTDGQALEIAGTLGLLAAAPPADPVRFRPPLLEAAGPALALAARLGRLPDGVDGGRLRRLALATLATFADKAAGLGLPPPVPALCTAALAALLDDALPADGASGALASSLGPYEDRGRFVVDVEDLVATAPPRRDAIELVFTCLSLGIASPRVSSAGVASPRVSSLGSLRERLWQVLAADEPAGALSPEWPVEAVAAAVAGGGGVVARAVRWLRGRSANEARLVERLAGSTGDGAGDPAARERFREAMREAGRILHRKGRSLDAIDWYAIVAPPMTGMVSAIRNAGLVFPLDDGSFVQPLQGVGDARRCTFWLSEAAMFVDTGGQPPPPSADDTQERRAWQSFLALLARTRPRRPLDGVVLMVGVPVLVSTGARGLIARTMRARLAEMRDALGMALPATLVVTQLDRVAGFVEFYDALDRRSREQVLGFAFPPPPASPDPRPALGRLIARQRDALPGLLRQEGDAARRCLIQEFPAQFAQLAAPLADLCAGIFGPEGAAPAALPRGVCFASARQEGEPIDLLPSVLAAHDLRPLPAHREAAGRAFFLRDLFGNPVPDA